MSKTDSLPFDVTVKVRDNCMCLNVQRAARVIARRFDEAFRPLALTSGQFSLLMSLNRPAPPTIGATAEVLAMDRTTLTANLKPLERRGLLKVAVDKTDKRSRRLVLTPAGRDLLLAALPVWKRTNLLIERQLLRAEPDALRSDLRALS